MSQGNFWNISHVDYAKIQNDDKLDGMVLGDIFLTMKWEGNWSIKDRAGHWEVSQIYTGYPLI